MPAWGRAAGFSKHWTETQSLAAGSDSRVSCDAYASAQAGGGSSATSTSTTCRHCWQRWAKTPRRTAWAMWYAPRTRTRGSGKIEAQFTKLHAVESRKGAASVRSGRTRALMLTHVDRVSIRVPVRVAAGLNVNIDCCSKPTRSYVPSPWQAAQRYGHESLRLLMASLCVLGSRQRHTLNKVFVFVRRRPTGRGRDRTAAPVPTSTSLRTFPKRCACPPACDRCWMPLCSS